MQRFRISIASTLAFVALSALDLFAFKWAYSRIAASFNSVEAYFEGMISVGLIPVGNAVMLAIYLAAHRHWTARFGRGKEASARAALAFALCATSGILLIVTLWATAPTYLIAYFGVVSRRSLWLLRWSGLLRVPTDVETPLFRFVIDPFFMAFVLSGPLMLLAWIAGAIAGKSGPADRSAAKPHAAAKPAPPRRSNGKSRAKAHPMNGLVISLLIGFSVAGLGAAPTEERTSIRVEVPLSGGGELDLADLVGRLSSATDLQLQRPPSGITLPVKGIAGTLSRKMLEKTLGEDVRVTFGKSSVVFVLDESLATRDRRDQWAGRLRELAAKAQAEAKRRLNYGMHALRSYRPNDPTRPTVCLVHGMNSSSGGFIYTIPPIEQAEYGIVVYDYPFNRSLEESCLKFARELEAFRREMGEKQPWALVGHSMGTLLVREYIEGPEYRGDIACLVQIAPVNQGSHLAKTQSILQLIHGVQAVNGQRSSNALAHLGDGVGEAANDMLPGSAFLKRLNSRPRRAGMPYHIIAGDVGLLSATSRARIDAQVNAARTRPGIFGGLARFAAGDDLPERLDEVTDGRGDGCVAVARTKLPGVSDHVVLHANHAELIRAPLLFSEPGPVACMPDLLRALDADIPVVAVKR